MRRPTYGAVTGVTTVLVVVCAMRLAFESLIPPPHPEVESWARGEFAERAEHQDIRWRRPERAFGEAGRLSRPLFVVIGVPWSGLGRQADAALMSPEVARALDRGFVPVRIDAAQDPRWLSQFLPLQGQRTGLGIGFQGWVFDLKGRIIGLVGRTGANETLDATSVLDMLLKAQSGFSDAALGDDTPAPQIQQDADVRQLLTSGMADLSLANAARTLAATIDPTQGGWNSNGIVTNRPLSFRFLQLAGAWSEAGRGLRLAALSPRADWLDGGFYRLGGSLRVPEYDKQAVDNAQLAEALAVQDAVRPDPLLRKAARRTVAWLLERGEDDLLPSAEAGDEDEQGRSRRASFSPRKLSDAVAAGTLSPSDRAWAETFLRLDEGARIPLPVPAALGDSRLDPVLAALRRSAGARRATVAEGLCEPNGAVVACLLRCARLWGDRDLANAAGILVDRLEGFRGRDGVHHSRTSSALPYLGDALAYADAELEDFLTNGRVPSLQRGAYELRRALRLFGGPERGILRPSPSGTTLLPEMPELPQITDDEREALSATALRLVDAYAAALGPAASDLVTSGSDLDAFLGGVTDSLPGMGGALAALARHADPRTAFVVGPDAASRAARLARLLPNRLVVPVLGPARPDLRDRPRGIYVSTPTGTQGPFDETTVLGRLPRKLEVGL